MKSSRRSICVALCALGVAVVCLVGGPAQAAFINYGDHHGSTVSFLDVTEASVTDPPPLFGPPTVSVDTLSFTPQGFGAFGMGGAVDLTDGQLTTTLAAKPGQWITEILITENGDFSLAGTGTSMTYVEIDLMAILRVTEVNGSPITPVLAAVSIDVLPAATPDGKFTLPDFPGLTQSWSGQATFNVDSFLASKGISGHATRIDLTFDNTLFAASEAGTAALIMKKMVDITPTTVPEPGGLVLLGMASLMIGLRPRRRKS